ncbi:MAG: type I polyketide synthase, partial [Mycobacterium sp.]
MRELEGADQGFAVVGYAVRFPGAPDVDEFWNLLQQGRDAISEVPGDRWDVEEFYDPEPGAAGKMVTRRAGFLDDVAGFDASFFGVSAREAVFMDPQHRVLMETAWRAVEYSGNAPSELAGTKTGVFMGLSTQDYLCLLTNALSPEDIEAYLGIGTSAAAGAGRISYRMGLLGPAITVDTACSSSLVAVHQACQALRFGECDLALAGGVNLLISPATMINFSRAHMLAPDGRCKTFDAAADGYVRGEGCGVVVVKRLDDAIRDGDRIRAVIRGSAVNQDGASGGLTVPNGTAQQRVIAAALQSAGVEACDVDYLEAHGTGTTLGDPIEVQAAGAAFGEGRDAGRPLLIGSVKTNIGHLEAAAGIAGLIKVILSLEHEELPKHLNFQNASPHIPWDRLPVRVVDEAVPWTRSGRPRVAGISGFGFSGTNAHLIVEEAPTEPAVPAGPGEVPDDGRFTVLPLSARTPAALVEVAQRYRTWLTAHPDVDISDVCLSAGVGRSHFEQRAGLVVNSTASANELLDALVDDRPAPGLVRGECGDPPKTAWLFPGQGSQYVGMGRELFESEPVFMETVSRCAAASDGVLEKPLLEVIFGAYGDDVLRDTSYAQPALFAVEMGLARLWQSWGLEPDVVLGHSVGQYSAACVTGVFGLEDGAMLLAERGRLFGSLPAGGRMVAAFADAERVESCVDEFPRLAVAAYNGANTVLSGPAEDLERAVAGLTADDVRCEWLDTSHAFHSALLDPVLDEFESYASGFEFQPPQRTLVCNRTGVAIGRQTKLDANYWRRHARQPVEFAKSVGSLAEIGCTLLLEVGPQPVLTAAALRAWPDTERRPEAIASLRRGGSAQRHIGDAFAQAYVAGHRPDFAAAARPNGRKVDLPTYPFQHRKFWYTTSPTSGPVDAARTETVRLLEEGRIDELAALVGAATGDDQTVGALKQLAAQHNQQRSAQTIADARYELGWEKSATTASALEPVEGLAWLLIADDAEIVAPLAELLTAHGHSHQTLAMPGSDADEAQFEAALRAAAAEHPALRIVHLGGLHQDGAPSVRSLDWMQHRVLGGTQRVFRAAEAVELDAPVWLVTRGAQRVTRADTVSPVQSIMWGFGRSAFYEHPRLWGGLADMAAGGGDDWSGLVAHILTAPAGEDQLALREGTAYFARLSRRSAPPVAAPLELRRDGAYLVTGGLGAVGLELAEYLAAHGAGHLILTGRRPPTADARRRVDAVCNQYGCEVVVLAADVSNPDDVARVLTTARTEMPPLVGIVHAAGELGTATLLDMDDVEVDRVFAGKVWGAWHLSEAAASLELDFLVFTSSIAAVWGAGGQIVYGAANAFLDGLAWRLRERGVPGISVEFGLWSTGMADAVQRERLDVIGIRTLSSSDALSGMAELITASAPHGIVARIDWPRFVPFEKMHHKRSMLANIERELPEAAAIPTSSTATQLTAELEAAPVQQRKQLVLEYLRNAVAEVTRIDAQDIRDDAGFFDLGMDSLMAVELQRRLERGFGRQLPVTLAMDHPHLADAAAYLVTDVLGLAGRAPARTDPVVTLSAHEPIAIVGLACRFPGARDAEAFWQLLADGVDMIREIPEDRYDVEEFYDPDPDAAGKIYTRYGGFLDGIDGFDPEFFGISPREAVWIDPQQRLVLETAWEGLERAGYAPSALRGSRSGVYVGVGANEYSYVLSTSNLEDIEAQFATGNATAVIAGRVAFALGLEGPAVSLDTACSSSLVAIHTACQALQSGDCDLALAVGVNVLLSPVITIATSRARMLSPDGRCKTFDAAADGYVRSEGCGMLVLKRLSDAVRDGDRIQAVVLGSAVNQDGASGGLTVPNGGAQQRVIATALSRAGLTGGDVDYLEAHGTGTALGDPIEVQAAGAAFGTGRDPSRPLLLGSVKTNIGHLESAAGVAGLIKVVLSLEHGILPQNLHFEHPSPHIPWDRLGVRVVDKQTPWQANAHVRRAGISSFGFSGTNAHVLIEEAPATAEVALSDSPPESVSVLPVSGRSPQALVAVARRYAVWLDAHPDVDIADMCFAAGAGRSHFEHRAALVVDSVGGAREALSELSENRLAPGAVRGVCGNAPKTAWLFTGQGSQYPGMARELFDAEPVFNETVTRCAEVVDEVLFRPLLGVMFATDGDSGETLRHTSFAQPALFAVEMGLARLWQSWGIEPDVVLGHSVGQYAAACVAEVFSLEDGARLVAERGRLFGGMPEGGRMVAVFADPEHVEDVADEFPRVSVAAYNGPNTVLAGPAEDLERLVATCSEERIRSSWLDTSHAFHSELMEPALADFETYAEQFEFAVPALPLVCNRAGTVLTAATPLNAQYWRRHARQPVQFAESVRTVAQLGCSVLMEIGPQPILSAATLQVWPEHSIPPRAIASARKGVDARRQMTEAVAAAYVAGHRPDFAALQRAPRHRLELPTYPFQRRSFWPKTSGISSGGIAVSGILGATTDLASGAIVYTSRLSVKSQPWLTNHVIYGTVVVPGATYAAMVLAAVEPPAQVQEVFFYEPILLNDKDSRELQLTLQPSDDGEGWTFEVSSRPYGDRDSDWSLNAGGTVRRGVEDDSATDPADPIDVTLERLTRARPQQLFDAFVDNELALGPVWRSSLKSLWVGDREAVGDITVGEDLAEHVGREPVHPVLLDLCTGIAGAALFAVASEAGVDSDLFLPLRYGQVVLRERMPGRFYCRARWQPSAADSEVQVFDLDFVDRDGRNVGGIREFTVKRAPREALLRSLGGDATRMLYGVGWRETPPLGSGDADSGNGTWLVAGFDELTAELPNSVAVGRVANPEQVRKLLAQAAESDAPVSGIVLRATGGPAAEESSTEFAARLEAEIGNVLDAVHVLLAQEGTNLAGGLWV